MQHLYEGWGVPSRQEEVAKNAPWGPEFQRTALDSLAESAGKGGVEEGCGDLPLSHCPQGLAGFLVLLPHLVSLDLRPSPHHNHPMTWAKQKITIDVSWRP